LVLPFRKNIFTVGCVSVLDTSSLSNILTYHNHSGSKQVDILSFVPRSYKFIEQVYGVKVDLK